MDRRSALSNPYKPGPGHFPPHLAGRVGEQNYFARVLREKQPNCNFLITGLRGFGKTVFLERLRVMAEAGGWLWISNDLSESSSLSEERLATRILTDLAQAIAFKLSINGDGSRATKDASVGGGTSAEEFGADINVFAAMKGVYENSPGLPTDRLKAVLNRACALAARARSSGLVLAYDEAQCLTDHVERNEYPMSMLVETIGSLQKNSSISPMLLVLSGLPHVQDALIETRTYTERMFYVMHLDRLSREESVAALAKPLENLVPPLHVTQDLIEKLADLSGGYPYLIQFFGKELIEKVLANGGSLSADAFPDLATLSRLDAGLFGARWNKTTDKQREALGMLAKRVTRSAREFSAQELSGLSNGELSNAQASQMLQALCDRGLIYRTRHGRFAFTVPMSEEMILRRIKAEEDVAESWQARDGAAEAPKPRGWRWFR